MAITFLMEVAMIRIYKSHISLTIDVIELLKWIFEAILKSYFFNLRNYLNAISNISLILFIFINEFRVDLLILFKRRPFFSINQGISFVIFDLIDFFMALQYEHSNILINDFEESFKNIKCFDLLELNDWL